MSILNICVLTPNDSGYYHGTLLYTIANRAQEKNIRAFVIQTIRKKDKLSTPEYDEEIGWNQFDAWLILPNAVSSE